MLTNEQVQAELEKLKNEAWVAERVVAAETLPGGMRDTARSILGADNPKTFKSRDEAKKRQQENVRVFKEMDATARRQFFEVMVPGHGLSIERGWQLIDRLPYQAGYGRKPFRAPGHPETLIGRRINWALSLISIIGPYRQPVTWFAAWAPHLAPYMSAEVLGIWFAATIDGGDEEGEEVFQILCASGRNEHAIGGMGRHVTRALLSASRPEGWEFVEKMLLAAQREEGLRQTILETVDEAHPQAFRRMLKLILDHDLARFSATIRAFDTWLGYQWDAVSSRVVNQTIGTMLLFLEDQAARDSALQDKNAEQVYLALWAQAFDDAVAVLAPATALLKHDRPEHRFVAVHLLSQLNLLAGQKNLLGALDDADIRVAARALQLFQRGVDSRVKNSDLFDRLEKLLDRCPAQPSPLKPAVWPWTAGTISRSLVAGALPDNLGERPATRLIPHLAHMETVSRVEVLRLLAGQEKWDTATRDTLFALVGDPGRQVRETALELLSKCQITSAEAKAMEDLLDRKAADLRRGVLTLLASQPDNDVLASADRLLVTKGRPQRLAGLELLRQLVEAGRNPVEARRRANQYAEANPKRPAAEQQQLDMVLATETNVPVLADALGLAKPDERTWPEPPPAHAIRFHTPVAERIMAAIETLFQANAGQVVSCKRFNGENWSGLLSELLHGFPHPDGELPVAEDRERLPLAATWETWWQTRGPELRDDDGLELLRAMARANFLTRSFGAAKEAVRQFPVMTETVFGKTPQTEKERAWMAHTIILWLLRLFPPAGAVEFSLAAAENSLALVPREKWHIQPAESVEFRSLTAALAKPGRQNYHEMLARQKAMAAKTGWRENGSPYVAWLAVATELERLLPDQWNPVLQVRYWKLLRWLDEPVRPAEDGGHSGVVRADCLPRQRGGLLQLCLARQAGGATDADVIEQLLGDRDVTGHSARYVFSDLNSISGRRREARSSGQKCRQNRLRDINFEFLPPLVERCRQRILAVELTRGDTPTAAAAPALSLASVAGVENLAAILQALGKRLLVRGWAGDNRSMETVFSHLVRCCFPRPGETAEDFRRHVQVANISPDRLVELAVYAPQWAGFVEQTLGWNQLTEAVWWIHAHTKGADWTVDREIRELWQADISARTSLSAADLLEGGVDVLWFHRIHRSLGSKRWETVYDAAKFASTGAGHARARLFADAMLGDVSKRELVRRINQKRHQDAVRAVGLLPLAAGTKRDADVLDRYKVIQEFRRGSKQFGSQRQASEKRAAQIGQQNLAHTAGYADPIRLEWAMEAKAVEDLADGPIEVLVDEVKVSLGIDPWGEIELNVTRAGKTLSDIPASLKKNPKIAALRTRKVELKRQAARIRPSLEQFMVRGDEFSGTELGELMTHPLLSPMLKNLVIIGEGIMGYPVHGGKALENHAGETEAIKTGEKLRIAHPHDLLPSAAWHRWQKDCFARERIQPFKQVFRELYPLTQTEQAENFQTRRYAGHQVQPRQALALLGQRGWVHHPEEGVRKVFHEAGLVAWLHFQEGFNTPAEIEGLTLESVFFTRRGDSEPVKLDQLPPRLFSETMRDLDLVVSVAHRGGVDPEASASTVEMRSTLVEETVRLLKLDNVEIKDRYALIKGALGEYSVHLGSAMTRKMPGETLFIVAVHSQHRGRLFLPFADEDPRTAEVMSKVLLLARDREIKDPNILDQIRHG